MGKAKSTKAPKKPRQSNHTKQQPRPALKKTSQPKGTSLSRSGTSDGGTGSPFTFMQRFSEEMNRLFEDYGLGSGWLPPTLESGLDKLTSMASSKWSPQVEVLERDNHLVVRADLPGMSNDNVAIDFTNDAVVISGERRSERKEDEAGYYRSERSYGSFYRRIPLPEGVSSEKANAKFHNGVLEIQIPLTQRVEQKRRQVEISGESAGEEQTHSRARAAGQR